MIELQEGETTMKVWAHMQVSYWNGRETTGFRADTREQVEHVVREWTGQRIKVDLSVWQMGRNEYGDPLQRCLFERRIDVPRLPPDPAALNDESRAEYPEMIRAREQATVDVRRALDDYDAFVATA